MGADHLPGAAACSAALRLDSWRTQLARCVAPRRLQEGQADEAPQVVETPTAFHLQLMGQNQLLQRTGFRQGDVELEDG